MKEKISNAPRVQNVETDSMYPVSAGDNVVLQAFATPCVIVAVHTPKGGQYLVTFQHLGTSIEVKIQASFRKTFMGWLNFFKMGSRLGK